MLDLFSRELPDTIEVDGEFYYIQTDYKYIILFYRLVQNNAPLGAFDFMYPFEKPDNRQKGFNQIQLFINPPQLIPRSDGNDSNLRVVDYDIDSDYIFAAFFEQYGIDLMSPSLDMHWYKFLALFRSLKATKLNDIIEIRSYTTPVKGMDHDKFMTRLRQQWELPQPAETTDDEALEKFDALLK